MTSKIFFLLFITAISFFAFGQSSYRERLNNAISKIKSNTKLEAKDICAAIPATQDEYSVFLNMDMDWKNDTAKGNLFFRLVDTIRNYRTRDHCVLIRYLNIAAFADGEYAESYFGGIEYLYAHNRAPFKKAYKELSPEAKRRLNSYINEKKPE